MSNLSLSALLDVSIPEAVLAFSALCFALKQSQPASLNRTELPHIIAKAALAITAVDNFAEDYLQKQFEEAKNSLS